MICTQCPRKCAVQRSAEQGYCQSGEQFKIARAALHFDEEPCISGKNGSGTIFFSGCNLRCVYCQNYEISRENNGRVISDGEFLNITDNLIDMGAQNINLVNPSHYALKIASLYKSKKPCVPVVYNTSGYDSVETLRALDGVADIYLADYKYTRSDKAKRYSNAADYPEVAARALFEMYAQAPRCEFTEDGMMKKGLIIRHLVLPSNTNSAIEAIDFLCKNFPGAYLSVMAQYTPCGNLKDYPEINRKISKREYEKVLNHIISKNFENAFIQELSSASKEYIPDFDCDLPLNLRE